MVVTSICWEFQRSIQKVEVADLLIRVSNKKVLLRERKRHTARRVVSTPSVVLPRYPPPPDLGTPPPPPGVPRLWYPPGGYPDLGTPPPGGGGVPGPRYPPPPPPGVPEPWYPPLGGVPGPRYPPPPGCLMAFWEMLQSIMGYGYPPPPVDRQTPVKTVPSRRTTYAGGNNCRMQWQEPWKIIQKPQEF